jgi:hypothetical protein
MTSSRDHERYRRQLEKQLRADAELLYAAYVAKLRAYETVHSLGGGVALDLLPPADLPLALPAAAPPAQAAPVPAPPKRGGANELHNAVCELMGQLPEVFERADVYAALGYEPHRASLHRVLMNLVHDGWTQIEKWGGGRMGNLYRKLPVSVPKISADPD